MSLWAHFICQKLRLGVAPLPLSPLFLIDNVIMFVLAVIFVLVVVLVLVVVVALVVVLVLIPSCHDANEDSQTLKP